jgi:signal transduction histidine kinase
VASDGLHTQKMTNGGDSAPVPLVAHQRMVSLQQIAELVMLASNADTLEQVLQKIAEAARQIANARYTALGVPDHAGGLRHFKTTGMTEEEINQLDHLPMGHGLLGAIMNEQRSIRLPRLQDDPRSSGFPAHHPHMQRFLGVPIAVGGELYGMLYLCDRQDGHPFDADDQTLIETLAGYAALAIAGAQLSDQRRRIILLQERDRVAMELHDGIIQSLYAIGMQLQLFNLDHPAPAIAQTLLGLDHVIEDIRRYIMNLRSTSYHQQTIYSCLRDVVHQLHIPPTLHVEIAAPDRQPPIAPPILETTCQIVREALSNVIRHANATHVLLQADDSGDRFSLTIHDNGKGFDTTQRQGLGLQNMLQRAEIIGANFTIRAQDGQGTLVKLLVPIGR